MTKTAKKAMQNTDGKHQDFVQLEADSTRNKYFVEHTVRHRDGSDGTECLVRWYGYTSSDNTLKSSHHIPNTSFIKVAIFGDVQNNESFR